MSNNRFTIAMHIMTLLATTEDSSLSSEVMAGSMNLHPVLVRKELANLRRNGLVITREGKKGGSALARPAAGIEVSEIYRAVREESLLGGHKHDPNPACPVGKEINIHLADLYLTAEAALMQRLQKTTLEAFAKQFTDPDHSSS